MTLRSSSRPGVDAIRAVLTDLDGSQAIGQARLLLAVAVGPWADGVWRAGNDVDLRAVYAFPAANYLGLTSFRERIELNTSHLGFEIDLIGFEIETLARLILEGDTEALAWLCRDDVPIWLAPGLERLLDLAVRRAVEVGAGINGTPRPPARSLYEQLDRLVRWSRMGRPIRGSSVA